MLIHTGSPKLVLGAIVLAAASQAGFAQSFNIDLDNTVQGVPDGGPSGSYGAALGQLGFWSAVRPPVGVPVGLFDINGNRTTATLSVQAGALSTGVGVVLSPDGNHLWRDGFTRGASLTLSFADLANGTYTVATIVNSFPRTYRIAVSPSIDGIQLVSGSPSDTFTVGSTHTLHHSHVVNGTMTVTIADPSAVSPRTETVGIQLKRCASDINDDGAIDFFDYLDFVDAFAANLPIADFNLDDFIDFFDYLDFVDIFSTGC